MIIKTVLVSMIIVAIVVLALGIKMLFDKNAKFEVHSCNFYSKDSDGTCYKCQVTDPADCSDRKDV